MKVEVTSEKASIHLEPSARSPIVEVLERGAILTLASAMKFRTSWLYVVFPSSRSGRKLSGYVLEDQVCKLGSTLRVIDLTPQDGEILEPREIDLTPARFPKLEWGRSRASILQAEGRPLAREISSGLEVLTYRRDVMNKKCQVEYVLNGQKLVGVRLKLLERYADKGRYISDYNKIRDFLTASVGEPRYNNIVWKERGLADRNPDWGVALSSGRLSLSSEWIIRDTGLRLSLSGDNNEVFFAAELNEVRTRATASF